MREHMGLFRGKRVDNGKWVEGYLLYRRIWKSDIWVIRVCDNGFDSHEEYEVDPDTVGECTGLKDKNGKLIFEGDILRLDGVVWVCCWDDGNLEISLRNDKESIGMAYMAVYNAEIIGNIHDNPELLKGGEGNG